ncbi:MAG: polysaccharide biosynthesis C-terminal domain-containing protein [Actinobacteria bacterium]|nr:polysaccharide biosynthesis C-terminal domain-containing protein [Actinomycetota bacterium]
MDKVAGRHLERIARGGSLSVAGAGVSAVAGFLVVVVITNGFSKDDAGALFSASSLFLLVLSVAGLGIAVGLGRYMMKYIVEERWAFARACLRNTALVTTVIGIVSGVGLYVLAEPVAVLTGLSDQSGAAVMRVLAIALPFGAIANWALSATRAMSNIRQTVLIEKAFRSLLQVALVALCVVTAVGIVELTWAWVLPTILSAPLAVIGLRSLSRRVLPPAEPGEQAPGAVREFWGFTWPRSIAQVSQMVIQRADIIIIGALISPAAAAIYTAATRFVPLGQLGVQAVQQVIQPRFTQLLATGHLQALGVVFKTTTAWNVAMAWPIYFVIGGLPGLYLTMFGDGFDADGVAVVVVMMLAMLVGVGSGPVDTLLLMSGKSSLSLINSLVALALNLVLNFTLIPVIGILGAAVAWWVAITVRSIMGYFQVRSYLQISPLSKASAFAAGASAVCFLLPLGALTLLGWASFWPAFGTGAVGLAAYLGLLWWQRDLLQLRALRSLIPSRMRARRS